MKLSACWVQDKRQGSKYRQKDYTWTRATAWLASKVAGKWWAITPIVTFTQKLKQSQGRHQHQGPTTTLDVLNLSMQLAADLILCNFSVVSNPSAFWSIFEVLQPEIKVPASGKSVLGQCLSTQLLWQVSEHSGKTTHLPPATLNKAFRYHLSQFGGGSFIHHSADSLIHQAP